MPRRNHALNPNLPEGVHHPSAPGITAQIISQDNEAFPTYASPDNDPIPNDPIAEYLRVQTITTYVAATNETPYAIHLRVDRPYPKEMDCSKLQFQLSIDGKFVWNVWCHRPRYVEMGNLWEEIIRGMKQGKGQGCKISDFKFKGIKTNEESLSSAEARRLKESMSKFGEIEIKVFRTTYGKKSGDVNNSKKGFMNDNSKEVPEKALKGPEAKSHGTALDVGRKVTRGDVWTDANIHGDQPIIIFRFLYRSEAALKSLHIIAHTPTPSRSSSPEIVGHGGSGLTADQAKQVEELLRSFRNASGESAGESSGRKRVKREDVDDGGEVESSERVVKRRRAEKGKGKAVMIDLTGDDGEDEVEDEVEEEKSSTVVGDAGELEIIKLDDDDDDAGETEIVKLDDSDDEDDDDECLFIRDNRI
ncbi:hypothetical protein SBOR_7454 [Sclerotinia borealis F-4128]|uniref:DUF7918 domain-containing protein n=1 Tax=Sclerotinia borealis (strain F-4128) TaxID=1432307 RepID=W9CBC1_SCLBF|nr:hypothetical protein SBOR_7454 [Sclerotinia borealis F-4128]